MPILSELSRRFHMLTTDAKPDPPRIPIDARSSVRPLSDEKVKCTESSSPVAPRNNADALSYRGTSKNSEGRTRPNCKTKSRSKAEKQSRGVNVIKYNIINSHKVNIGSRTSYVCNVNQYTGHGNTARERSTSEAGAMPNDVKLFGTCVDVISSRDIFIVKTHVGHGWRDVARQLCYSDGQIEQFEENYRNKGVGEIVYQLLLDWKRTNTSDATVGILASAMWTCQEYECVRRWIAARRDWT